MASGMHRRILRVMDDIERAAGRPVRLDEASTRSGISKYHLQRVFKSLTGRNLGEYIRARVLARSLAHLLGSDLRISDIAAQCGFSDYTAYTHAFTREFGISPSEYRHNPRDLPVTHRLDRYDLYGSARSLVLRPRIVAKPAFSVVGQPHRVTTGENLINARATRLAVEFFRGRATEIANPVDPHVYIGLTLFPEGYPDGRSNYTIYVPSIEVKEAGPDEPPSPAPPGMSVYPIKAQTYAVFRYVGLHPPEELVAARLRHIFEHVWEKWLPQAGVGRLTMSFERVDERVCSKDYSEIDLHYPIEPLG